MIYTEEETKGYVKGLGLCVALVVLAGVIIFLVHNKPTEHYQFSARLITLEGCQYYIYNNQIVHKGNCTNIYHQTLITINDERNKQ